MTMYCEVYQRKISCASLASMNKPPATRAILQGEAGLGRTICIHCLSLDGMQAWTPAEVWALEASDTGVREEGNWLIAGMPKLYRHHTTSVQVFAPCWSCRADGYVADGYVLMTPRQVHRWLEAQS